MKLRILLALVMVLSLMPAAGGLRPAVAFDQLWVGANGDWNTPANWQFGVPRQSLQDQAVIGATDGTMTGGVANLGGNTFVNGGVILGRDAGTDGTLNLTPGAVLSNMPASGVTAGTVVVGQGGRGYLNMTGGTLSAVGLSLGGENIDPVSAINLSGSAIVDIQNTAGLITLNGNMRITGPGVDFDTNRPVTLQANSVFTAEITGDSHSPIKTDGDVTLGGNLAIEFNGATPTPGDTWDLFDIGGGLSGSFANVAAGADVQVTGAPAPAAGSAYRLRRDTGGENGNLLQLALQELLVLQVNRDTGAIAITNPFGGDIGIDGYTIESRTAGSLLTSYKGISGAPAADTNWFKPTAGACDSPGNSACVLAEIKEDGTGSGVFDLSGVPTLALGTGFDKLAVASNVEGIGVDGEDLVFSYSSPGVEGGQVRGHVQYIGTKFNNNLTLRVNPNSGEAFLQNDSQLTLTFDGYSILSATGALNGAGWDGIGGSWEKSPAGSDSLTETNLSGAITLDPGEEVGIGDISAAGFASDAAQAGLSLQFILSESLVPGDAGGDYNNDGVVNAADYIFWRNNEGETVAIPNENPAAATPGVVDQEDYDYWVGQFGNVGGIQPEETFRTGAVFFDPTAGSGAGANAAVPEPSTGLLVLLGLGGALLRRRERSGNRTRIMNSEVADENVPPGDLGQIGASNMFAHKGRLVEAAMAVCVALLLAIPAAAQPQGIPLVNQDFDLPGGGKIVPFDAAGAFVPDQIPGWIFSGPGMETRFNPTDPDTMEFLILGDSSVEPGSGFGAGSGNHLTLSTLDGTVYQTSAHNGLNISANQVYRLTFDALDAFTIDDIDPPGQIGDRAELTAWIYYQNGGNRTPIATQAFNLLNGTQTYTVEIAGGTPGIAAAAGNPIGVEFDTTTIEFNAGMPEFPVAHSWVAVDNVVLQIAGTISGDLNGDGAVTPADYNIVRDNQQLATDYLADGDVNGDGIVNLNDFRAIKTILDAQPGSASGGDLVPEPSTALMAILLAAATLGSGWLGRSNRGRHVALLAVVGLCGFLAISSPASAELLYYDPFLIGDNPAAGEYQLGLLAGQNPTPGPMNFFSGAWTYGGFGAPNPVPDPDTTMEVVAESLEYLGIPSPGGSVTGSHRVGRFLDQAWDATTNDTFYLSFQAKYGTANDPNGTDGGNGNLGFRTTEFWPSDNLMANDNNRSEIGYQGFGGAAAQQVPSTAQLRLAGPGIGTQFLTDIPFNNFNQTHLIVMKFELSDQAASDSISVFLDPTVAEEPEIATVLAGGLDFTMSSMSTISFFGNTDMAELPSFDELYVGTEFADVLPELPCAGDTDGNCAIDINDFNTILANFNRLDAAGPSEGDVAGTNGRLGNDGRVDLRDYRIWRDNRTDTGGGTLADLFGNSVPEPTTGILFLLATMLAAPRRWR